MPGYIPPAGLGSVIPSSPAQGVVIGSSDQLVMDYVIGKTIIGGSQFADTLGRFFPVIINNSGITLNSTNASGTIITFHNTTTAGTDELIGMGASNSLFIEPNSTTSVNNALVVADRTAGTYLGIVLYPALVSGGTTQPEIDTSSPAGTANTVYRFGTNFLQLLGSASGASPVMYAVGGDAAINLNLGPKGTGSSVIVGPNYANQIFIQPAPAGFSPNIGVTGSDTDIYLNLTPKGAGVVGFNYATTALGGGAAPTFGTIGGSGPVAAGQRAWLKVTVNSAIYWVPLWA